MYNHLSLNEKNYLIIILIITREKRYVTSRFFYVYNEILGIIHILFRKTLFIVLNIF